MHNILPYSSVSISTVKSFPGNAFGKHLNPKGLQYQFTFKNLNSFTMKQLD